MTINYLKLSDIDVPNIQNIRTWYFHGELQLEVTYRNNRPPLRVSGEIAADLCDSLNGIGDRWTLPTVPRMERVALEGMGK